MARSRPRPTANSAEHRHDVVVVDRAHHQAPTVVRSQSFPAPAVSSAAAGSKRCSPFPTRLTTRFRGKSEYTALEEGTTTADRGDLEAIRSERIGCRPPGGAVRPLASIGRARRHRRFTRPPSAEQSWLSVRMCGHSSGASPVPAKVLACRTPTSAFGTSSGNRYGEAAT